MKMLMALAVFVVLWGSAVRAEPDGQFNPQLHASSNGVHDAAHTRDLLLQRFDVAVEIRGAVAETTVDATFANATDDTLEGDFRLVLPAGAIVTGYALDIGNQMVDGVLVDRPHAKAVYDARVRRGIDPGLAEVTADNVFETHVNPIWPHQGRRIRLRFVTPIDAAGLHLPFAIGAPLGGWSIAVHATGLDRAPLATAGKQLKFEPTADGFAAKLSGGAVAFADGLMIGRSAMPDVLVSEHRNGERDLQLGGALADRPAGLTKAPGRLRIYWDRSHGRESNDLAAEIDLARQMILRLHPAAIELVAFNSSGATRKVVANADEAAAWLRQLQYRGASSYASLAGDGVADRCLLFANGGPTIDRAVSFAPRCRLDAVTSAAGADKGWLRHLALGSGGAAYTIGAKSRDLVVDALTSRNAGVVGVTDQDGKALPFVPIDAPAGRWLVLVKAPEGGPVTVHLNDADGARDVVLKPDGAEMPFDGAGALIAADRLSALGATDQREQYIALSRKFGIANPSLSFLVLETPADYFAAHIEPPANYPSEARDTYLRQYKANRVADAERKQQSLDAVIGGWQDMVAWWSKRFDPAAKPRRVVTSGHFDRTESNERALRAPAPAMVVPPPAFSVPAPPPPPPPPSNRDEMREVVVTGQRRTSNRGAAPIAKAEEGVDAVDNDTSQPTRSIQIDPWQPDRPYLELYDGKPEDFDARFLEAEQRHGGLPIFYLDTAEWLRKHGQRAQAVEMVLSALELPTANDVTLGIVADRLERYGELDRAIELRERQAVLDPDRPQPRRLLALALARRAAIVPGKARADLARAVDILYGVAVTPHDATWNGIELIALDEANALLQRLKQAGGHVDMDPRLIKLLDADIRVVIDWTTDASDMDLWVDEPDKERAIYNNRMTAIGGRLSQDMTQGYGPEEYMLRAAPAGTYTEQVNVFAPDRLDPNGATLVTAHVFRNYGRPTQKEESVDIEVKRDDSGSKMIGKVVIPPARP